MKTKKSNKISFTVIENGIDDTQLGAMDMMNMKGGITGGYPQGPCGANGCAADACPSAGCAAAACGANGCLVNWCGGNACGGNVCSLQLCPIDACPADACWVDFFVINDNICQKI